MPTQLYIHIVPMKHTVSAAPAGCLYFFTRLKSENNIIKQQMQRPFRREQEWWTNNHTEVGIRSNKDYEALRNTSLDAIVAE